MCKLDPVHPPPQRVVVRTDPAAKVPDELQRLVPDKVLGPLASRASRGCRSKRDVKELVDALASAHVVAVPEGADPIAFAKQLGTWSGATEVYLEPRFALPPALETAQEQPPARDWKRSVNALPQPEGADGRGVGFVDVEWGFAEHEAIPRLETVFGVSRGWWWHGNAVLGVMVGRGRRMRGLVPRAHGAFASPWTPSGGYEVTHALTRAIAHLDVGDVLLIELQSSCGEATGLPVEVDPVVADLLALAGHSGIVVVEAAGNGGWNLDEACVAGRGTEVGASGAILVGAVDPEKDRRAPSSCYGAQVDCAAWGDDVATAWSNHIGTARDAYTPSFSGTSAAAAIVAGVAIAVQSAARSKGRTLAPQELRDLLVRHGHPVDGVGAVPDLTRTVAAL